MWATDVKNNSKDIELIFKKIGETFPGVPLYPILGNHESHPCNM